MLTKILRITLTAFVLTCFVGFSIVHASGSESTDHGPHDALDQAKRQEFNAREEAQRAFDTLQTVNRLVGDLGLAYSAKSDAIAKGKSVTIAAGVGAVGSAVLTGGVTAPTVTGIIGASTALGISMTGADDLLYSYDSALSKKESQITIMKNAIETYNEVYHNKYLKERSNHLAAVMTHNAIHHKPVRTKWNRTPDYSMPSFSCGGNCGQTFKTPLGDHGNVCGMGIIISQTDPPGCEKVWYSCVPSHVKKHDPIDCTLDYKIYRKLIGEKRNLVRTNTCPAKFRRCQAFPLAYHEEIHHGYIDAHGNFRYSSFPTHITYDKHIEHKHNAKKANNNADTDDGNNEDEFVDNSPSPAPDTPSPPTMHACGVHATTVSGDHSHKIPPCGDDTHAMYACQIGSDHSMMIASCSETNEHGDTCEVTNFYACQNHADQYPTRVECGYSGCNDMVLSRNEHRTTCMNGHLYWSCNPSGHDWHQTRICPKGKWTHQRWNSRRNRYEAVWGVCGESWAKCNWNSCTNMYGVVSYHQQ